MLNNCVIDAFLHIYLDLCENGNSLSGMLNMKMTIGIWSQFIVVER